MNEGGTLVATSVTQQHSDIWDAGLFYFVGQLIMHLCYNFHDSTLSQSKITCSSRNTMKTTLGAEEAGPYSKN
jgi:hypothetical protein